MKNLLSILLILAASGNIGKCQSAEVKQIEFSKETRGYQEHIRLTADSLNIYAEDAVRGNGSTSESRKLEAQEWVSLVAALEHVKLSELDVLASPTMKRASDGAMHATITITTKEGKTFSHGFDDDNPHQVLQPLVKAIRQVAGPGKKP